MANKAGLMDDLHGFLERVERLDRGSLLALSVRASDEEEASLVRARKRAEEVAGGSGQLAARDRLKGAIVNWASAGGARAGIYGPDLHAGDVGVEDIRMQAAQAIFDAATVELLGPDLDPATAEILRARWESAIG